MARLSFRLATAADGPKLQALLADIAMPGKLADSAIVVTDFWQAVRWATCEAQVIVATVDDLPVGFGVVQVYPLWLQGERSRVGYLSQLRLHPRYRGSTALARGYRLLAELRQALKVRMLITAILDGNQQAQRLLTSGKAGLPHYRPLFAYRTYILPLGAKRRAVRSVKTPASSRQDLSYADWAAVPGLASFALADDSATLTVTTDPGKKATRVLSYHAPLAQLRPLLNAINRWRSGLIYPRAPGLLPMHYAAQWRSDSPQRLLHLCEALAPHLSARYLALGLPAAHPYEPLLKRRAVMTLASTLYQVCWPDTAHLGLAPLPELSVALL
jgi:hypothetical protein